MTIHITREEETLCLEAIRRGAAYLVVVSAVTGCKPSIVDKVVAGLVASGQVQRQGARYRLTAASPAADTPAYFHCPAVTTPPIRPGRMPAPGSTGARLLALLDRPRSAADLPAELGVTKTALVMTALNLHAAGLLRIADPEDVLHLLLPADDPTPPLTRLEEIVLSTLPADTDTTERAIIKVVRRLSRPLLASVIARLVSLGLVTTRRETDGTVLVTVAPAGLAHVQRRGDYPIARPDVPLRSERRIAVLKVLADCGPLRVTEVSRVLGLPQTIANALIQHFKRKGFLEKVSDARWAGYIPTAEGLRLLSRLPAPAAA
ncbi:MAG: helix-turn-helix domain-containing protein [Alphaproteobacteria bacterium]